MQPCRSDAGRRLRGRLQAAAGRTAVLAAAVLAVCAEAASNAVPASLELDRYQLRGGPKAIAGVTQNASGLAYSGRSRTLFVVVNAPCVLAEVDPADLLAPGPVVTPRRWVRLRGFDDTEGLAWIASNRFAVVEERRRNLVEFELADGALSVDYASARVTSVEPGPGDNFGLEGLAWDPAGRRFFIVKEKSPRRLYRVDADGDGPRTVVRGWDIETASLGMDDLAGAEWDPGTGHLLILSDESRCVVEATPDGRLVSRLSLRGGHAGLDRDIIQPEGLAMDGDGNIYVGSEPNGLQVFSRGPAKP